MKYCDDAGCPNFSPSNPDGDCKLGFKIHFRVPRSMGAIMRHDWGYVMPKMCRIKFRRVKAEK